MSAFLHRSELVFKVHAAGAGFDHGLHQFKGIQDASKTGFRISNNRYKVIDVVLSGSMLDFVGTLERVIDATDHRRYRIDRVKRLIGIHRISDVGIRGHLPAGQVNRFGACLDLLYRLSSRQRAKRWQKIIRIQSAPQFLGSQAGKAVLNMHRTAKAQYIGR